MSQAEHDACGEIERIIQRVEQQHGWRVHHVGIAHDDDGRVIVWLMYDETETPAESK